ncbi:hypothetical protein DL768_009242 [Monosporascus sp. mg162]|nr:hypothetical protein DL768_009242 [Monosporascus sp. mg162]
MQILFPVNSQPRTRDPSPTQPVSLDGLPVYTEDSEQVLGLNALTVALRHIYILGPPSLRGALDARGGSEHAVLRTVRTPSTGADAIARLKKEAFGGVASESLLAEAASEEASRWEECHETYSGEALARKGLVAYDGTTAIGRRADGPGTYVAAMSIRGFNGEFLCVVEIEDLIRGLRKHCKAYIRQKVHQGSTSTPEDKTPDESVCEVDAALGSRSSGAKDRLRFIRSDDAHQRVLWLIESCRPVASRDGRPDASPRSERAIGFGAHHLYLGADLVPHQERARAGPGGDREASGPHVREQPPRNVGGVGHGLGGVHYIFVDGPFFGQNVNATQAELRRREKYVEAVDYIAEQTARDPEDSLAQVKAQLLLAEATKVRLEMARTEADARVEQLRERRIAFHNQLDMLEDVREIIRTLMSQTLKRGGDKEQLDS